MENKKTEQERKSVEQTLSMLLIKLTAMERTLIDSGALKEDLYKTNIDKCVQEFKKILEQEIKNGDENG